MTERAITRLPKWPFLLGDVCLLGVAAWIAFGAHAPLNLWLALICLAAVALGAWICIVPFLREHTANLKLAETDTLADTVAQMRNLESIQSSIADATGRWQDIQSQAGRTVQTTREISDQVAKQMQEFSAFFQKAADQEKNTLRLEVDKLKRAEAEWLQVLVRILDNVYALHQAGIRTGQQELIRELTQFQIACREMARRVGLVPFAPAISDPFDERKHQTPDAKSDSNVNGTISEVVAPGFTFQAQLLRRALVRVMPSGGVVKPKPGGEAIESVSSADEQPALPLSQQ